MITRVIHDDAQLAQLRRLLQGHARPFTVNVLKGARRSNAQNRLQRQWLNDAAAQGDQTAEEYRAECKLWFGIPILRAEDERFREEYDRVIKPLAYEHKLALMAEPFDFSVTRRMTKDQKTRYLNAIWQHFTSQGFALTDPGLMGLGALEDLIGGTA